ncbi:hypothetical protein CEN46_26035 [Fischerella thermalis CCMEE 5318]|uniref:Uncharacterized protein n=1 Tax=Fischerella thermalis CCMEE 5318 TaxID=2019666 RepID=A0A2N6L4D0_9CYAN|nr:hypothetical protein CEN46_26035 [Fischerella thermalis CCMEE 5318]
MSKALLSEFLMAFGGVIGAGTCLEIARALGMPCLQAIPPKAYFLTGLLAGIPTGIAYVVIRSRFENTSAAAYVALIICIFSMSVVLSFFRHK